MPAFPASRDFIPHLHTVFRIETPVVLELELAEVADRSNARLEQFSVIFTGPASPWLQQGTYTLRHPHMQEFDLFIVPLGLREGCMLYEAVFSRVIPISQQPSGAGPIDP